MDKSLTQIERTNLVDEAVDMLARHADTKRWTSEREARLTEIKSALGVKKIRQAPEFKKSWAAWTKKNWNK